MSILVTGGAGYIGSHIMRLLKESGEQPIALDDLSTGLKSRVSEADLIQIQLASPQAKDQLVKAFLDNNVTGVLHLAAKKSVTESVDRPEYYFEQNINSLLNLLGAMQEANVTKLVFSSSAAVYGSPENTLVKETELCQPINPYGQSKLIGEWMMANAKKAWGLKVVSLRYFNVAGAGYLDLPDSSVANLIPIILNSIKKREPVKVFGTDWPTPDGSCVRDYIHISDLASAHLRALSYLDEAIQENDIFNVGTGKGSSVFEVIETMKKVTGIDFEVEYAQRRQGDPAMLVADVTRINADLNWHATKNLEDICTSAYQASLG